MKGFKKKTAEVRVQAHIFEIQEYLKKKRCFSFSAVCQGDELEIRLHR